MMRANPKHFFETLPRIVKRFPISLSESCYLIPQLSSFRKGKESGKNFLPHLVHEVIEPTCNEWNHALALSLKEKGKRYSLTASWFGFKVPLSLKKVEICRFGSSVGDPENWFCCTKLRSVGFISKLLPSTVGYTVIACGSSVVNSL